MAERGPFPQNIIAVIWDFDKTLTPHYMQAPLFQEYGIDESTFWGEVNALPAYYERAGIHVQHDICYLFHLLSYVHHGIMPGLNNAKLRELGGRIDFFSGIPEIFERLTHALNVPKYEDLDLRIEHYVVSTGLAEMIRGSRIAPCLSGVWASEFIETPAAPGSDIANGTPEPGAISQIAGFLDNTTKTRALFEINKGIHKLPGVTVNDSIPEEERRVPFKNMIYIADGPSDIPSFSVVKKGGGRTYAVYDSKEQFAQAVTLHEQGRVEAYGPADYRPGTQTDMWLEHQVGKIAERIYTERWTAFGSRVSRGPAHIASHDTAEPAGDEGQ